MPGPIQHSFQDFVIICVGSMAVDASFRLEFQVEACSVCDRNDHARDFSFRFYRAIPRESLNVHALRPDHLGSFPHLEPLDLLR